MALTLCVALTPVSNFGPYPPTPTLRYVVDEGSMTQMHLWMILCHQQPHPGPPPCLVLPSALVLPVALTM